MGNFELENLLEKYTAIEKIGLLNDEEKAVRSFLSELVTARETIKQLRDKLSQCFDVKDAYDEATLHSWYIASVGDEEPVWTEKHIEELMNDFYLFPKSGGKYVEYTDEKTLYKDIAYWSNSLGELYYKGEFDLADESELPMELQQAYEKLWTESPFGSNCYLMEYKGQYGIALINEYDTCTAGLVECTMDELYELAAEKAKELSESPLLADTTVISDKYCGFDGCHKIIVFIPYDTTEEKFNAIAEYLYKNVYTLKKSKS